MKKKIKKFLSLLLAVMLILSSAAFSANAATEEFSEKDLANSVRSGDGNYNDGWYNYRITLNVTSQFENTANDEEFYVILRYKTNNGNGLTKEKKLYIKNAVPADSANKITEEDGVYAVKTGLYMLDGWVEGFPCEVVGRFNKANGSGSFISDSTGEVYFSLSVWDYSKASTDFTELVGNVLASKNGTGTFGTKAIVPYSEYPKADNSTISITPDTAQTLQLPDSGSASLTYTVSANDQYGTAYQTMRISGTAVSGLTYSANKMKGTVCGNADANFNTADQRDITVTFTFPSGQGVAAYAEKSVTATVKNTSAKMYAPTYDNREVAGLSVSWVDGNNNVKECFDLDSNYCFASDNYYIVLKNNSTRTATINNIATDNAIRFGFAAISCTIAPGQTEKIKLVDMKRTDFTGINKNYQGKTSITYTLDGLYDITTGKLATLNAAANVSFKYVADTNNAEFHIKNEPATARKVNCYATLKPGNGLLTDISVSDDSDVFTLTGNYYIDYGKYGTWQAAGLNLYFRNNYTNKLYFQTEDSKYNGEFKISGSYASAGTFGFTSSTAKTATSGVIESANLYLGDEKGYTATQNFYGTIVKGNTANENPAKLIFQEGDSGRGMQIEATQAVKNSAYLCMTLNVYSYDKTKLRATIQQAQDKGYISLYYGESEWNKFNAATSSALQNAEEVLGSVKTTQYAVLNALNDLSAALSDLDASSPYGSCSLTHQLHETDAESEIAEDIVEYYIVPVENVKYSPNLYSAYLTATSSRDSVPKHTYNAVVDMPYAQNTALTYDYWNIDFTKVNDSISLFDNASSLTKVIVADTVKQLNFTPESEALYTEAKALDQTANTASPSVQDATDETAVQLETEVMDLEFKSFTFSITHKMLDLDGVTEISNDKIQTYTEKYNKTCTYSDYLNGNVSINDSTYTILGETYAPIPDSIFLSYSDRTNPYIVSTTFPVCQQDAEATIKYRVRELDDQTLNETVQTIINSYDTVWPDTYTTDSINEFLAWFESQEENGGILATSYNIFDENKYQEGIYTIQDNMNSMLAPVITQTQCDTIQHFITEYDVALSEKDDYCYGQNVTDSYFELYNQSKDTLNTYSNANPVGTCNISSASADELIAQISSFESALIPHSYETRLTAPLDGIDGTKLVVCKNCGVSEDEPQIIPAPNFNNFYSEKYAYDYSVRGGSLKADTNDSTHQPLRFTAAVKIPEGAEVTSIGYVYTQTKYVNDLAEPDNSYIPDDNAKNQFKLGTENVYNYEIYPDGGTFDGCGFSVQSDSFGNSYYTYNIVINVAQDNWDTHYCARGYIHYNYNGESYTVYDQTFSSRSVHYIAQCVSENPNESVFLRNYVNSKILGFFGE